MALQKKVWAFLWYAFHAWIHEGLHRPVAVECSEAAGAAGTNAVLQSGQVLPVQAHQDFSFSSAIRYAGCTESLSHTQISVAAERMGNYGMANYKIAFPAQYT